MQEEELYTELAEVEKQAFVATAEGVYLDRHIEGTFGVQRTQKSRSTGYVTVYTNSPIQNPDNLKLKCAYYDAEGVLQDLDVADKFVTSGNDAYAGRVFALVAPFNSQYVTSHFDTYTNKNIKVVNLAGSHPRFLILPVVSMTEGILSNVPENSINQFPSKPAGIDGVINTYTPSNVFSTSSESYSVPFSVRFTDVNSIRNTSEGKTVFDVTQAYYFSQVGGSISLEDKQGSKLRGRFYKKIDTAPYYDLDTNPLEKDITFDYIEAQSGTISLVNPLGLGLNYQDSVEELPFTKVKNSMGTYDTWVLLEVIYKNQTKLLYNSLDTSGNVELPSKVLLGYLRERLTSPDRLGLIVRQVKSPIDLEFVFDPDNVLDSSGNIQESSRIGGAVETEDDSAYRSKFRKYLSSLAKATDAAIETGALQTQGVSYAKVVKDEYTPRGSTVLLISAKGGVVDKGTFFRVKKSLTRDWKASGINLVIKTPQQVDITVLMSITLKKNYSNSKDKVSELVKNSISTYFDGKNPGESISYSELLSKITTIEGVSNVWNMFFGKKLTTEFYNLSKSGAYLNTVGEVTYGGYDYFVLFNALANSNFKTQQPTLLDSQYEAVYVFTQNFPTPYITYKLNGASHTPTVQDNYKRAIVTKQPNGTIIFDIQEDAEWDKLRLPLLSIKSADAFIDFIVSNKESIFEDFVSDTHSMNYVITQLSSEVSLLKYDASLVSQVPVNVPALPLRLLEAVKIGTFGVPKLSTLNFNNDVIELMGIDYINADDRGVSNG